jgi:DNA-directed RNA polymerase subunit RPC12/RpoP
MKCPKCGSTRIKRSHARDFQERLQKLFFREPYRCIDCGWRGIRQQLPSKTKLRKIIINIIGIILIAIAIIAIMRYLAMEPDEPYTNVQPAQADVSQ